jgi:hypothetical protein
LRGKTRRKGVRGGQKEKAEKEREGNEEGNIPAMKL